MDGCGTFCANAVADTTVVRRQAERTARTFAKSIHVTGLETGSFPAFPCHPGIFEAAEMAEAAD